jgi:hypothetical protein
MILFVLIYTKDSIISFVLDTTGEAQIQETQKTTDNTTKVLLSLDKITFDTSVLNSPYFESLVPFVSYPIDAQTLSNFGKANPFIGNFIVVAPTATTTVGGVVYSSQRQPLNNGQAVRSVPAGTRR